jgi:hypothetical protein
MFRKSALKGGYMAFIKAVGDKQGDAFIGKRR